jgi:putative flippase GtrA
MEQPVTPLEARAALDAIERSRLSVIDQIDLPNWYWWGLALGWIVLGILSDLDMPWLSSAATVLFGAAHATIAPRVMDGRHASRNLSVRRDVAGHQLTRFIIAGLVGLVVLTIAAALAVNADGAGHPATIASVLVAAIIVLGGPQLPAAIRRRAAAQS